MLIKYYPLILDEKRPPDFLVRLLHQAKISGKPRDLDKFKGELFANLYPLMIIVAHVESSKNHDLVAYRILDRIMALNFFMQPFSNDLDLLKFIQNKLNL